MARPKKPVALTEEQIERLAQIGCTDAEIASLAGIDEATVERRFAAVLKRGRNDLKARLRRAQIDLALGVTVEEVDAMSGEVNVYKKPPHASMAIYLGKVILRQVEAKEEPKPSESVIRFVHEHGTPPKAESDDSD